MDKIITFCFCDFDINLLDLFCRTFRQHNESARIMVCADKPLEKEFCSKYKVSYVIAKNFENGRMIKRIEMLRDEILRPDYNINGQRIISTDADLVFLDDPFKCFDQMKTNIGFTTRMTTYHWPVNAGFSAWITSEETEEVWSRLLYEFLEKYDGDKDWYIDQEFLCWLYTEKLVPYDDLGWVWNFCPGRDVFGNELVEQMYIRAYESKSVKVIHLKDRSKNLMEIFDVAPAPTV